MLGRIRSSFLTGPQAATLDLGSEPVRLVKPVRIGRDIGPVELTMGKTRLHLLPDTPVSGQAGKTPLDWVLIDPDAYYVKVCGFERIRPGRKVLLGRDNERLDKLFGFRSSVAIRHATVANDAGDVIIKPMDSETEVLVGRAPDVGESKDERYRSQRARNLAHLREVFGGPIGLLPPEDALETIEQAVAVLAAEPHRPKDARGRPGGVLDLPSKPTPIVVGDLHAEVDNLLKVLVEGQVLDGLVRGDAILLLLGDTVHNQIPGALAEMDGSLLMLDLILKLKIRFPAGVFWLRGNHETLDESVGKIGVPQGLVLLVKARARRGDKYVEALATLFEALPYAARTDHFIAVHAGPTRSRVTIEDLTNIRDYPHLAWQLTWNRMRTPTRPAGYTKKNVKAFRASLGAKKGTPLIVSHSPVDNDGTVWMNAGDIKNHHIVYSANRDRLAVLIRAGDDMVALEYPAEPILDFANRPA